MTINCIIDSTMEGAIAFHGHCCPGLTLGYQAAQIAMRELKAERAEDEELVAVCQTNACGVDAIQWVTGCTMGKGNLFVYDHGKNVFSFGRRPEARMIRIALRLDAFQGLEACAPEEMRQARIERLHNGPEAELFDIRWVEGALPARAVVMKSIPCSHCGEGVMEARARLVDGEALCPECFETLCSE
jgi:formylmethanofuran dehydrogenase subunit E